MDGIQFQHIMLCVSLFLASIQHVYTVTVECISESSEDFTYCPVILTDPQADITMVSGEDDEFHCEKELDYGLAPMDGEGTYIWVNYGCGGTFEVGSQTLPSSSTSWGEWSPCSVSCGTGIKYRFSMSSTVDDFDHKIQSRNCVLQSCTSNPATGSWNPWGAWSSCNKVCGGGTQERIRTCNTGVNTDCSSNVYANKQSKGCNTQACQPGTGNVITPSQGICGKSSSRNFEFRIIGGVEAKQCQYPWMVMVTDTGDSLLCGGSIIDSMHIMTAAHCVVKDLTPGNELPVAAESLKVYTGTSKMPLEGSLGSSPISRRVARVKIHENFNYDMNDIAILTLTKPIKFDNCHMPVCLPSPQQSSLGVSGCKVMGWGLTSNGERRASSSYLKSTDIKIRQPSVCQREVGEDGFKAAIKLCAGGNGSGSCEGDSGGPLVCSGSDNRFYQMGIVSSGEDNSCGTSPGLYTKVSAFVTWIKTNTQ